eukprot:365271-Chlamydomonas_euryale.AAC.15
MDPLHGPNQTARCWDCARGTVACMLPPTATQHRQLSLHQKSAQKLLPVIAPRLRDKSLRQRLVAHQIRDGGLFGKHSFPSATRACVHEPGCTLEIAEEMQLDV